MIQSLRLMPYLIILFIILGLSSFSAKAQLQIGDFLPEDRLKELKSLTSNDFPDTPGDTKLYILDFWSRRCGTCIASFPKMEGLQYQFRNEIKIVALNPWDEDEDLVGFWDLQRNGRKRTGNTKRIEDPSWEGNPFIPRATSLPADNGDGSWLDLFEIQAVPRHIWLDEHGQVIAMPWGYSTSASNIEQYLRLGKLPRMLVTPVPGSLSGPDFNLLEQWGAANFDYQQNGLYLREYYEGPGANPFGNQKRLGVIDSAKNTIRYSFINNSVADLYKAAWRGVKPENYRPIYHRGKISAFKGDTTKFFDVGILDNRIIWEVSQPEIYIGPKEYDEPSQSEMLGFDDWNLRAKFCAELVLPLEQQDEASRIFMDGLNRYFGQKLGVSGHVETRKRTCLVLKKDHDYRPLTSFADTIAKVYDAEHKVERYTNHPYNHVLLDFLTYDIDHADPTLFRNVITNSIGRHFMPMLNRNLPLVDETGITGNVDISLHVVPNEVTDPEEALNWRLKGTGLHVEKQVREIEMLVISDTVMR